MAKEITVTLKEETLERAKRISQQRGKSISEIIEETINSIPEQEEKQEFAIDEIKKIVRGKIVDPSVNWKEEKVAYLTRKYDL